MEETQQANQIARDALEAWQQEIKNNIYSTDEDFIHSIRFYFPHDFTRVNAAFSQFGYEVANIIEPLVNENNLALNLPRLDAYDAVGHRIDKVVHHPSYLLAGDLIYRTGLLENMSKPGGLTECLSLLFLSSQAGEAGHNCPIACSAGIIRVLSKVGDFPNKAYYLEKLLSPSMKTNFTGAQFVTEIQGGSDVGLNASYAKKDKDNSWRVYGEKWFCSNVGADLMFVIARYDNSKEGTKGLGLFLVPAEWDKRRNEYTIRRLKDKIGTRSMATGEIDFHGAYAIPMGSLEEGFHLLMDNVLHLSRLFNAFSVLGMARRAYVIANSYAKHRIAFANPIIAYPLVKETLARIKAENSAMLAGVFATAKLQDQSDKEMGSDKNTKLLLRLLVNSQKYLTALWSVEHIHQALGVLAGNGAIESFSPIPRLLRDSIVCENWEGTHNVLRMQILKDIHKYNIDKIFLGYMQNELKKVTEPAYAEPIAKELKGLESDLSALRQLDEHLQSLQIQSIVDRMTISYCALMLLQEGLDQQKTSGSASKLQSLRYVYQLHFNKPKPTPYDANYLQLFSSIALDKFTEA